VAVTGLVLLAAACGGDGASDDRLAATTTAAPVTTTTAPEASMTTPPAATDGGPTLGELIHELADTEEGQTELEQLSLELLVAPEDFGGQSFADAGYVPSEGPDECGVDVDADHPPSVLVGTGLTDADGRSIVEELRVFPDVESAAGAFEAHRTALACGTDGAGATFGEPADVNEVVHADAASEVTLVAEDRSGVVITALVGDAVLTFGVAAPAAAPPALDPREVAAFGVGKVLAALEAAGSTD
jgi:hypothetical protein